MGDGFLLGNITNRDYVSDYKIENHYTDNSNFINIIAILDIML